MPLFSTIGRIVAATDNVVIHVTVRTVVRFMNYDMRLVIDIITTVAFVVLRTIALLLLILNRNHVFCAAPQREACNR